MVITRAFIFRGIWLYLLLGCLPVRAWAGNQVGGHITMQAIDNVPGRFRIQVTSYLDNTVTPTAQQDVIAGISRKRDNLLVYTFNVYETGKREKLIATNPACAREHNLDVVMATYEAVIQLDPAAYFEAEGYYISYQTRFRVGNVTNLVNSAQGGYTFYLAFPPLSRNKQLFPNSSPRFGPVNVDYICLNEPFAFAFGGTDPDGDELRYSLVTPLNTRTSSQNLATSGPYPNMVWQPGFSATNAIPGNPALAVDPKTGQLSGRATQTGLFAFAVNVDEFRNGEKIGEVRREFQYLVINCPPDAPTNPTIGIQGKPAALQSTTICLGDAATLKTAANPAWHFQWQRDGTNLGSQTAPTIKIYESGEYTVVVSPSAACGRTSTAQSVTITVIGDVARLTTSGSLCATSGSVSLSTTPNPRYSYQWLQDGAPVPNATSDSLRTTRAGRYWLVLTHKTLGCIVRTDTANLTRAAPVQAILRSVTGLTRICPQDSLTLEATGGLTYRWQQNSQTLSGAAGPRFGATGPGTYVATVRDSAGCEGTSNALLLSAIAPIKVLLDSISPVCGATSALVALRGSPAGGVFSGPGVVGATFDPKRAGVGSYSVTYAVKAAPECGGTVAVRTAVVAPIPTIQMPDTLATFSGNTLTLTPVLTGDPVDFRWSPIQFLDNPSVATPSAGPILSDVAYTLTIKTAFGCTANRSVLILLAARIWIPNAFSPNGDGLNDVWQLVGLEAYPDAELTVFDRWGEVIHRSTANQPRPFDGLFNGVPLPAGVYPYTLRTRPELPMQRGSVLLIR